MKLLRYLDGGEERLGLLEGSDVIDLASLELSALLPADADTRDRLVAAHRGRRAGTLGSMTLAPPLDPVMILCAGENYTDHLDEKPPVRREEPEFFLKTPTAAVGHAATVPYPDVTKKLD